MADVIQIQEPDDKPIAAPNTDDLARLESVPQANTAIIPPSKLGEEIMQGNQLRFAMQQAEYAKHQKQVEENIKALSFKDGDIYQPHLPALDKAKNALVDYMSASAAAIKAGDMQTLMKVQSMHNDINNQIDASIGFKKAMGETEKYFMEHPEMNTDANKALMQRAYAETDPTKSTLPVFGQRPMQDAPKFYNELYKDAYKDGKVEFNTGQGNQTETKSAKYIPANDLYSIAQVAATSAQGQYRIGDLAHEIIDIHNGKAKDREIDIYHPNKSQYVLNKNPVTGTKELVLHPIGTAKLSTLDPQTAFMNEAVKFGATAKEFEQGLQGQKESLAEGENAKKGQIDYDTEPMVVNTATGTGNPDKPIATNIPVVKKWDLDKTGGAPRGIKISVPQSAYDVNTNQQLSKKDIGSGVWDVDVPFVVQTYQTPTGNYVRNDPNYKGDKKLTTEAIVTRKLDDGTTQTLAIPYSAVSQNIKNSKLTLNNMNDTQVIGQPQAATSTNKTVNNVPAAIPKFGERVQTKQGWAKFNGTKWVLE